MSRRTSGGTSQASPSVVSVDSGTAPLIDHITALVDGNVIYYDQASGEFKGKVVSGGGGGAELGEPVVCNPKPGRRIYVDFGNADRATNELAFSNVDGSGNDWAFGTDPITDLPCLSNKGVNYPNIYSITTKQQWRDFECSLRYRAAPSGSSYHPSTFFGLSARLAAGQLGAAGSCKNALFLQKSWDTGSTNAGVYATINNSSLAQQNDATQDSDVTTITSRRARLRVTGTLIQGKSWLESAGEPDWQWSCVMTTSGHGISDVNLLEYGLGQFSFQPVNSGDKIYITEMEFLELIDNTRSFIPNGDLALYDKRTSFPAYWTPNAPSAGGVAEIVQVADRYGYSRNAMHLSSTGSLATQPQISSAQVGSRAKNAYGTPFSFILGPDDFAPAIYLSLWSKGNDVTDTGGSPVYGAALVAKLYDVDGNDLSIGSLSGYSIGLGPTPYGPPGGVGTWGWTRTIARLTPVAGQVKIASIQPLVLFHDNAAAGEFWVQDVEMWIGS